MLGLGRQTSRATESGTINNKARHHPKSLLGDKKHQQTRAMRYETNACHSLVSSVNTVD